MNMAGAAYRLDVECESDATSSGVQRERLRSSVGERLAERCGSSANGAFRRKLGSSIAVQASSFSSVSGRLDQLDSLRQQKPVLTQREVQLQERIHRRLSRALSLSLGCQKGASRLSD